MYHCLFHHSLIDGYLIFFRFFFSISNNASVKKNPCTYIAVHIQEYFLGRYEAVELLGDKYALDTWNLPYGKTIPVYRPVVPNF